MGRPRASEENRELAVAFATIVTTGGCSDSLIPRAGEQSIFALFAKCFPSSVRNEESCNNQESRSGLSHVEFNKVLEHTGSFKLIRHRTTGKTRPEEPKNIYLYSAKRWRDPCNEHDRSFLSSAWEYLGPTAQSQCSLQDLSAHLQAINAAPKLHFGTRRKLEGVSARSSQLLHPTSPSYLLAPPFAPIPQPDSECSEASTPRAAPIPPPIHDSSNEPTDTGPVDNTGNSNTHHHLVPLDNNSKHEEGTVEDDFQEEEELEDTWHFSDGGVEVSVGGVLEAGWLTDDELERRFKTVFEHQFQQEAATVHY